MKRLLEGYAKFRSSVFPQAKDRFRLLADRQAPDALFITCADSRVVPDLILQTEPGDMFLCRAVGNIIPPYGTMAGGVSSTVEYAVEVLHVRHVIVCGHSDCGAIKAMIDRTALERLPLTAKWLGFVESAWRHLDPATPNDPKSLHTGLIHANIIAQYENLKTHPHIARGIQEKTLQVHGWYYDILTGAIEAWQETERKFIPLEQVAEQFAAEPAAS